jgi:hypothetical protein
MNAVNKSLIVSFYSKILRNLKKNRLNALLRVFYLTQRNVRTVTVELGDSTYSCIPLLQQNVKFFLL